MATAYTSLLGLALPVQGELQGTWGDTVNNSITSLLDTAVAGTTTLSTDADVTLTTTTGASNQARQAILLCSGVRTAQRTITAPAQSKIYTVINNTTGGFAVKLVGVGPTTGVTIPVGAVGTFAWNGTDFVDVSNYVSGNKIINGNLTVNGNTTLGDASTDSLTVNAKTASNLLFTDNTYDIGASGANRPRTLYLGTSLISPAITNSGLTSGRVVYSTTNGAQTDSVNLTFNGTTLTAAGLAGPLNGTVGATTPNTGAFTTLNATGLTTLAYNGLNVGSGQLEVTGGNVSASGGITAVSNIKTADGAAFAWGAATSYMLGSSAGNTLGAYVASTKIWEITGSGTTAFSYPITLPSNGLNVGSGQLQVTGGNVTASGSITAGNTIFVSGVASGLSIAGASGQASYIKVSDVANGGKLWRAGTGILSAGVYSIYNETDNTFPLSVASASVTITGTASVAGTISSTKDGNFFLHGVTSNAVQYGRVANTTGGLDYGVASSTGTGFAASGGTAWAATLASNSATAPVEIVTNSSVIGRFAPTAISLLKDTSITGTLSATNQISSTYSAGNAILLTGAAATAQNSIRSTGTTTNQNYWQVDNTSGSLLMGVASSAGAGGGMSGMTAYAGFIEANASSSLQLGVAATKVVNITIAGAAITGTLSSTGVITHNSRTVLGTAYVGDLAGTGNNTGLGFGVSALLPTIGDGTPTSATIDLGSSTYKFKDLHTSGAANIGGNLTVSGTNITTANSSNPSWTLTKSAVGTFTVTNTGTSGVTLRTDAYSLILGAAGGTGITIDGSNNTTAAGNLTVSGTGTNSFAGPVKTGGYTVATLPANAAGLIAYVTDQLTAAAAKGVAPTGGGAVTCYVMNTGAGWVGI